MRIPIHNPQFFAHLRVTDLRVTDLVVSEIFGKHALYLYGGPILVYLDFITSGNPLVFYVQVNSLTRQTKLESVCLSIIIYYNKTLLAAKQSGARRGARN